MVSKYRDILEPPKQGASGPGTPARQHSTSSTPSIRRTDNKSGKIVFVLRIWPNGIRGCDSVKETYFEIEIWRVLPVYFHLRWTGPLAVVTQL